MGSSQSHPEETDTIRVTLDNNDDGEVKVSEVRLSREELQNLNDVLDYSDGSIMIDTNVIAEIANELGFETYQPEYEEEYEEEVDEILPPDVGYPAYPPYQPFVFPPSDPIGVPFDPIGVPTSDPIDVPTSDPIGVPVEPSSDTTNFVEKEDFNEHKKEEFVEKIEQKALEDTGCVFDMPEKEEFVEKIEQKALEDTGCVLDMPEKEEFVEKIEQKALEDTGCVFDMPEKEEFVKKIEQKALEDTGCVFNMPEKKVFVEKVLQKAAVESSREIDTPKKAASNTKALADKVRDKITDKSEKVVTRAKREQLADSLFGEFKKQEVEKIIVEAKLEGARSQAKIDAEYMSNVVNSERDKWRSKFAVIDENLRKRKTDLENAHIDAIDAVSQKISISNESKACDGNINEVMKCYSEYPNQVLRCKALADSFDSCVSNALRSR